MQQERQSLRLLDIVDGLPITSFDDIAGKYHTRTRLKEVLQSLDKLESEGRHRKINQYNYLLYEIGEQQNKSGKIDWIDYMLGGSGLIPGIGSLFSIISILRSAYKDIAKSEKRKVFDLIDKISEVQMKQMEKEDVYMLNKIDRVARLKK